MSDSSDKKYFCPRLIDYVTIVGRNSYRDKTNTKIQTPQLLRKYPPENHKDFPLPPDMVYFCQPEGCLFIRDRLKVKQIEPFFFIFSLTDKDSGRTRYGACLNFYRPLEKIRSKFQDRKSSGHIMLSDRQKVQKNLDFSSESDVKSNVFPKNRSRTYSLTSLCILSHHGFFSVFRECLNSLKKIIDACKDSTNFSKSKSTKNRVNENVWSVLTGQINELTSSIVIQDIGEIENWILRLIQCPVPKPGKTKLKLNLFTENRLEPQFVSLPDHKRFSLIDFPLHLPIELLGIDNFIKVLTLILLENKIIFQSRNYNMLSMSIMAFVSLIYPLEYMFPVIPLLPTSLNDAEQLLYSPTPYIIGIPASFSDLKQEFRYPDDIWLVDLDSNSIKTKTSSTIPSMPETEVSILKNNLNKAMALIEQLGRNQVLKADPDLFLKSKRKSVQENSNFMYAADLNSIDIAIRVSLVQFFNSSNLLANFSEHTRTLRLYPRPVVAFQIKSFLRSRDFNSAFLIQFSQTQAVEFFAEWSLTPENVTYLRVQTGVVNPLEIGDKLKWYENQLDEIEYEVWDTSSSLNGAVKFLNSKNQFRKASLNCQTSDSEDILSSDSSNDENLLGYNETSSDLDSETKPISPFAYRPPSPFTIDKSEETNDFSSMSSSDSNSLDNDKDIEDAEIEVSLRDQKSIEIVPKPILVKKSSVQSIIEAQKPLEKTMSLTMPLPSRKSENLTRSFSTKPRPSPPMPPSTSLRKQPNIGNVFARKSSIDEPLTSSSRTILKQMASQAKEIIRQSTTRQDTDHCEDNDSNQKSDMESTKSPLEQLTLQAKKVAEKATESVQDAGKTALEAGKNAAGASKNTFEDLTFISKSKMEDLTASAKNVVTKKRLSQDYASKKDDKKFAESSKILSNIGSDIQILANSTSSMFSDFFKSNKDKAISASGSSANDNNQNQIRKNSLSQTSRNIFGPFSSGTKSMIEKSQFIRHSIKAEEKFNEKTYSNEDNRDYVLECTNQIMNGEGIGWIKFVRLKKLLEDESIRNLVLDKINLTLAQKMFPDDRIDDVIVSKPVWKGMLKILVAVANGLEVSNKKFGNGSLASTYQLHEIGHTHYWSKNDSISINSKDPSPLSSSTEGLEHSLMHDNKRLSESYFDDHLTVTATTISNTHSANTTTESLKDLLNNKRKALLSKLASIDSDSDSLQMETASSGRGSITSGPSYIFNKFAGQYRQTASDTEIETSNVYKSIKQNTESIISNKTSYSNEIRKNSRIFFPDDYKALECERFYLYEGLLGKNRVQLWDKMDFWDDVFYDIVSNERDMVGLEQGSRELMDKYKKFSVLERKRLEHEEDRLLSTVLYNLTSIMLMLNIEKRAIQNKVRRWLGKCHISMIYSKDVNNLLDNIYNYNGNDIELKPMISRRVSHHIFMVHVGANADGDLRFIEVRDDGLIIRSDDGVLVERWWFERLVNMTYSPKTKVLCLWKRNGQQTTLQKFYTKKCRQLYYSIKESIEKSGKISTAPELGGEFPVQDLISGEGGLLQICIEGVGLLFMNSKADKICYAVLCVFSYVAAGQKNVQNTIEFPGVKSEKKSVRIVHDDRNERGPPLEPAPVLSIDQASPPPVPPRIPLRSNQSASDES